MQVANEIIPDVKALEWADFCYSHSEVVPSPFISSPGEREQIAALNLIREPVPIDLNYGYFPHNPSTLLRYTHQSPLCELFPLEILKLCLSSGASNTVCPWNSCSDEHREIAPYSFEHLLSLYSSQQLRLDNQHIEFALKFLESIAALYKDTNVSSLGAPHFAERVGANLENYFLMLARIAAEQDLSPLLVFFDLGNAKAVFEIATFVPETLISIFSTRLKIELAALIPSAEPVIYRNRADELGCFLILPPDTDPQTIKEALENLAKEITLEYLEIVGVPERVKDVSKLPFHGVVPGIAVLKPSEIKRYICNFEENCPDNEHNSIYSSELRKAIIKLIEANKAENYIYLLKNSSNNDFLSFNTITAEIRRFWTEVYENVYNPRKNQEPDSSRGRPSIPFLPIEYLYLSSHSELRIRKIIEKTLERREENDVQYRKNFPDGEAPRDFIFIEQDTISSIPLDVSLYAYRLYLIEEQLKALSIKNPDPAFQKSSEETSKLLKSILEASKFGRDPETGMRLRFDAPYELARLIEAVKDEKVREVVPVVFTLFGLSEIDQRIERFNTLHNGDFTMKKYIDTFLSYVAQRLCQEGIVETDLLFRFDSSKLLYIAVDKSPEEIKEKLDQIGEDAIRFLNSRYEHIHRITNSAIDASVSTQEERKNQVRGNGVCYGTANISLETLMVDSIEFLNDKFCRKIVTLDPSNILQSILKGISNSTKQKTSNTSQDCF
jgi:hypothetical protein